MESVKPTSRWSSTTTPVERCFTIGHCSDNTPASVFLFAKFWEEKKSQIPTNHSFVPADNHRGTRVFIKVNPSVELTAISSVFNFSLTLHRPRCEDNNQRKQSCKYRVRGVRWLALIENRVFIINRCYLAVRGRRMAEILIHLSRVFFCSLGLVCFPLGSIHTTFSLKCFASGGAGNAWKEHGNTQFFKNRSETHLYQ